MSRPAFPASATENCTSLKSNQSPWWMEMFTCMNPLSKASLFWGAPPPKAATMHGAGCAVGRLPAAVVSPGPGMGAEECRTQQFLFLTAMPQPRRGRHSPFPNFLFLNSGWSHVGILFNIFFETTSRSMKYHANGEGVLQFCSELLAYPRKGKMDRAGSWPGCKDLARC